jgi:aspartokinase/homoserine dehydrogenase 1
MVLDVRGIDPAKAKAEVHGPAAVPVSLDGIAAFVAREKLVTPVFVDCTADSDVSQRYAAAMEAGLHVVTANKIANSSGLETYRELRRVARRKQRRFMYETNVGAGLPVISTLQTLVQRGDRVLRIEGVLSGSMSYLLGRLEEGVPLSHAVREAKEKGFTEPDPREDLSGRDVARKVLILAREVGLEIEPQDVHVEGVLEIVIDAKSTPAMRSPALFSSEGNVESFFDALPALDAAFARRVADLGSQGKVLRFVGTIEDGRASVGLRAVDVDHPLRSVKGGENALAFLTEHYSPRPMVIRGYGAGAEVTAAGVLADILSLASWSGA